VRVLTVHNRYQHHGGEDESQASHAGLLREHGHTVDELFEDNARVAELGAARVAARTVWSMEGYRRVRAALRRSRYDLIEAHNTFPLISPALYYAAHAEGVPVMQVLHNYRLVCPSATLYRDAHVCEDCLRQPVPWPGVVHGCYRESRAASAAVASMIVGHRLLGTWRRVVDLYVTPTEFTRRKLIEGGLPADRIAVKPHFVHPDPGLGEHRGGYALYVGRLAPEKGLGTLLAAWRQLARPFPLKVVGDGPLAARVEAAPGIEWHGSRGRAEVLELMGEASFLVIPSEWYETFGLVAIEAYAKGTPVLASRIGAVAEVVQDGATGRLFEPGRAEELAALVDWAVSQPARLTEMGKQARAVYEACYTAERNYQLLLDLYARAIQRR
jgi:glycosyltransferase involved in cell wall biosynthesis